MKEEQFTYAAKEIKSAQNEMAKLFPTPFGATVRLLVYPSQYNGYGCHWKDLLRWDTFKLDFPMLYYSLTIFFTHFDIKKSPTLPSKKR